MSEHQIQKAFTQWVNLQKIEGVELCFAVPNGGMRSKAVAGQLKAEGVTPGVPDVLWPVARGGFIGLAIEFKTVSAKSGALSGVSASQCAMIEKMQREGWCVVICTTWDAAARTLTGYSKMLNYLDVALINLGVEK